MKRLLLFAGLIAWAGAAFAEAASNVNVVSECFVDIPETVDSNSGADCGYVTVPQSRSGGSGGTIELPYMRLRGVTDTGAPPLFMLAGGPGQAIITGDQLLLFQPELLGPILETRDVVLMEQRGTYLARPGLTCPEAGPAGFEALVEGIAPDASEARGREILAGCMSRLAAIGVDFASYNTVESAADINDVRAALGYDRIVFYGASYGTLLGQFLMRDFPASLAAVVLDGTETPSSESWVGDRAERAQWGLDRMQGLCAAQPDCAEAFDILALVEAVFEVLGEEPITRTLPLPDGAPATGEVEVTVGPETLAATIYGLQTSRYGVAALPAFLENYASKGGDVLADALAPQSLQQSVAELSGDESGMVLLMHAAMVCSDDPPRASSGAAKVAISRYSQAFGEAEAREYATLCEIINVPQLPASSDALVSSDLPVLVLSGGLDVQTPSFLAADAIKEMPNATEIVFPAGFHVQIANLNRCAITILRAFVEEPSAEPDTGCVSDEAPLSFLVSEPGQSLFE